MACGNGSHALHLAYKAAGLQPGDAVVLEDPCFPGALSAVLAAGCEVVEAEPPSFERACELWGLLLLEEIRAQRPLLDLVMGEMGRRFLSHADEVFPRIDTSTLMLAYGDRNRVDREWHQLLTDVDVLLVPTWANPPFPLGFDVESVDNGRDVLSTIRAVLPANLLGLPAAVVPVGMADGTPVGAQVVGRRFADLTCLAVAELLEEQMGTITPIDPVR